MTSNFDFLLDMADDVVDLVNAEPFRFLPKIRHANGRPGADPDRSPIDGLGIFDLREGEAGGVQVGNQSFSRSRNDLKTLTHGRTPTLSVHRRELDGQEIRQGDRIEMTERLSSSRLFDVVSVQDDGHGRVLVELVAA